MSNSTIISNSEKQEWVQAADKAKEAAASVSEMASHAASAVGAMASQAAYDVGAMASQAASDVGKKADGLTASAGVGIQGLGDRLSENGPQTGMLGSASHAVAKTVKDSGEYLEGAKLSGMSKDVAQLIRQNPIPAVLIAVGLGWFVASKIKK